MLLTMEVLLGAATIVQGYRAFRDTPGLGTAFAAVGSAYILLILATSIALRKSFRLGATLSKIFLILRVPVLVPVYIVLYVPLSRLPSSSAALRSPLMLLIMSLIGPIGYVALFSAGWYAYFLKSKKVRKLLEASRKKS
jgi:hypothetical protein